MTDPRTRTPDGPTRAAVKAGLCEGLSNKVIARRVGVEFTTVKTHVAKIIKRLGARNRTHAAAMLVRQEYEGGLLTNALREGCGARVSPTVLRSKSKAMRAPGTQSDAQKQRSTQRGAKRQNRAQEARA